MAGFRALPTATSAVLLALGAATGPAAAGAVVPAQPPVRADGVPATAFAATAAPRAASPRVFAPLNSSGLVADAPSTGATGAIGPARYVEMVNARVAVFDRAGAQVASRSLDAFTSTVGARDPQVQWDPQGRRWFYVTSVIDPGADPASPVDDVHLLALGFSRTPDPSDLVSGWCRYTINTDAKYGGTTGVDYEDHPRLGHDDNFALIASDAYGTDGFVTSRILFYPKPAAGSTGCPSGLDVPSFGTATNPLRTDRLNLARAVVPANAQDPTPAAELVAADIDPATGVGDRFQLFHVNYATRQLFTDGEARVRAQDAFRAPAPAPQPGTADRLDTGDGRLSQAVSRADPGAQGRQGVWTQHTVAGAGGRSEVRWYEITPATGTIRQAGLVRDAAQWVFDAAISPTGAGDGAVLLANASGPSAAPSLRSLARTRTTPLGLLRGTATLATSRGPAAASAWSRSASATPDPLDPSMVWGSAPVTGGTRNVAVLADVDPPLVSLSVPGRWVRGGARVRARFSCADEPGGSGIVSCTATTARGAPVDTRPGRRTFTVRARDRAGHETSLRRAYLVDGRAPVISLRVPARGATVRRGARVLARYSCHDERGGSGVASCRGSVAAGRRLDTSRRGRHTFVVVATDRAGHRVRVVRGYRVR